MSADFQVVGTSATARFTLKVHRGEGMALLAMNWKAGPPPADFAGFAIAYQEPGGGPFFVLKNRLDFAHGDAPAQRVQLPSTQAPIQKFRWVHFPRNAELPGDFTYRVTPVFMDEHDQLSQGDPQEVALELARETYPGQLNVTFTRGFVSSQAFVDRWAQHGGMDTLLPPVADQGLRFTPTNPDATEALTWMGFEAVTAILEVLDQAIADPQAQVRLIAYDLNEPAILTRLEQLGARVKVIIDDSDAHGAAGSAESAAEIRLVASAGRANVKRQHMGNLQHNKTIVVDGPQAKAVVWGSTNFSWRGFYVQANNALVVRGAAPVALGMAAFDDFFAHDDVAGFGATDATKLTSLGLQDVDARIAFSPHAADTALLDTIGADIGSATSSVLYSLAFLYQTTGTIHDAVDQVTKDPNIFVYGISDRKVKDIGVEAPGVDIQTPSNPAPVFSSALNDHVPPPFQPEPSGGRGIRMHHKFVVIDFDKPTARVWMGSYNFSAPADRKNGENLLLIKDRRVATAYMIEALRIFDHYHFRVAEQDAHAEQRSFALQRPPRANGEVAWWAEHYPGGDPTKIRDRELFA
jgi:phosphatidylserine/phosphatidylglycerophosphate/cardiolipin synthase-like enzyme